jgi:hypothetical protein
VTPAHSMLRKGLIASVTTPHAPFPQAKHCCVLAIHTARFFAESSARGIRMRLKLTGLRNSDDSSRVEYMADIHGSQTTTLLYEIVIAGPSIVVVSRSAVYARPLTQAAPTTQRT